MSESNETGAQPTDPLKFDVRGCRGVEGAIGEHGIGPCIYDAPIVTAGKTRAQLAIAAGKLQALMAGESPRLALQRAIQSVEAAYAYVVAHEAATAKANDDAVMKSMFGRALDDEDVALAYAAAALGDSPTA